MMLKILILHNKLILCKQQKQSDLDFLKIYIFFFGYPIHLFFPALCLVSRDTRPVNV